MKVNIVGSDPITTEVEKLTNGACFVFDLPGTKKVENRTVYMKIGATEMHRNNLAVPIINMVTGELSKVDYQSLVIKMDTELVIKAIV